MNPTSLPFEYPFQWDNESLREGAGVTPEGAAILKQRDRDLEDYLASATTPLVFHWNGQVDRFVNIRNGPGEFRSNGAIQLIRYRWDTPAAAGATVEWRLDNAVVGTNTVTSANPHIEQPGWKYAQEAIVPIVTAVGSDARGLTAFVYLDA